MNKALIIPGSCAKKLNFSNFYHELEKRGYSYAFIELQASNYPDIRGAQLNLYEKLSEIIEMNSILIAHSMGAILLFLILKDIDFFERKNPDFVKKLKSSKIFLLQMPLKKYKFLLFVMDFMKFLLAPFLWIYSKYFFKANEKFLFEIKKKNFLWNQAVMLHSFLGTSKIELFNLINYYRKMPKLSERISYNSFRNLKIFFTIGSPDFFCSAKETKILARKLDKTLIDLPWSFHSPQNFKHSLRKLLKYIF